ncbi:hypothetical protein AB0M12_41705 [Nocardia vinacea]|uniref:hypothetical protein n=1 Tax=Nocardia vinacea TaxID=96468 RepID=UPI0034261086
MGRVIQPRPAAWEPRAEELVAQNALWEEQDRLTVALAMEPDLDRQQVILEQLDGTYEEVALHNWQADWERRAYAIPDAPFATTEIPEHLRFVHRDLELTEHWQPIVRAGELVDTQVAILDEEEDVHEILAAEEEEEQVEMELELH